MMNVNEQGTALISKRNKKWKEEIKYCPACYQIGIQNQLKLYQINMNEAVYLCPNYQNCLYPQANEFNLVNRSIDEMESDTVSDEDEDHPTLNVQDEVENLIQKMQSEFSQTNSDNIVLNSILTPPLEQQHTPISMLFSGIDNKLKHIDEKVVENINENNQILMETEEKSNYINNDLFDELDNFLNEGNDAPPINGSDHDVSNASECIISESLLTLNNAQNVCDSIVALPQNESEVSYAPKRITIVSETLLPPNNIEIPIDTQNVSAQCFTVECTPHNQISVKTITSSGDDVIVFTSCHAGACDEAGDSSQKHLIKTELTHKTDNTESETMLDNQKTVRRTIVSETLLPPNNIELPIDTQNVSTQCFTVECTPLNQISVKTITSSPACDEAGDASQNNLIKTELTQKTDITESETMLDNQKTARRSSRKSKNELPTKYKNFQIDLNSEKRTRKKSQTKVSPRK